MGSYSGLDIQGEKKCGAAADAVIVHRAEAIEWQTKIDTIFMACYDSVAYNSE